MTVLRLTLSDVALDLDVASLRLSESDLLRRLCGWNSREWLTELFDDHPDAIRFAWMLANQRAGTPLDVAFKDIDFDLADFDVTVAAEDNPHVVEGAEGSDLPTGPLVE